MNENELAGYWEVVGKAMRGLQTAEIDRVLTAIEDLPGDTLVQQRARAFALAAFDEYARYTGVRKQLLNK
mgnify:CR=1 FL=1